MARASSPAVLALGERLAPHVTELGFKAPRSPLTFSRVRGSARDRIALTPIRGGTGCRVDFTTTDRKIPGWQAGGMLVTPDFRGTPVVDITTPRGATRLLNVVVAELPFFELATDPTQLLAEAAHRYVPGFVEPTTVAPFLAHHLGPAGVRSYVVAMLAARSELWPSFLGHRGERELDHGRHHVDEGAQLAAMLATHAPKLSAPRPPAGTVRCKERAAGYARSFIGLQLRAWGEPEAARQLRTLDDATVLRLSAEDRERGFTVDDAESVARALRATTGKARRPRRTKPVPLYFQYNVLHEPFGAR